MHLFATFAAARAILFVPSAKELAVTALQHWFLTFFDEVISTAIETLVIAALGGIDVHGI